MILISFVENSMGMMFNDRRCSSDRTALNRILSMCSGKKLWLSPYSMELFKSAAEADRSAEAMSDRVEFCVDDRPYEKAGSGEFCLVESEGPSKFEDRIEQIYLYSWNRDYPHDVSFDADLDKWTLLRSIDFKGNSHDRITEKIFVRKKTSEN
jgi:hypothetical protein